MKQKDGSMMLMIIFIMGGVMVLLHMVMTNALFVYTLSLNKQESEQQYALVEGVLHYGIMWLYNRYGKDDIPKMGNYTLKTEWPTQVSGYQGMVQYQFFTYYTEVNAYLMKSNTQIAIISCDLEVKAEREKFLYPVFVIKNWHYKRSGL